MKIGRVLAVMVVVLAVVGCGKQSEDQPTVPSGDAGGGATKVKLALNWKPEPEFGGFYAAPFKKHGVDVEILPGGAGTPTVQMVGAGSAEFGIVGADELVVARSKGNNVVARPVTVTAYVAPDLVVLVRGGGARCDGRPIQPSRHKSRRTISARLGAVNWKNGKETRRQAVNGPEGSRRRRR